MDDFLDLSPKAGGVVDTFWAPGCYRLILRHGVEVPCSKAEFIQHWQRLRPERPLPWQGRQNHAVMD